ncbi:DUF2971 domain-containing protein [Nitrospirillum viridazoti]|uniref:DUF2971 domain-containing protein n=1 Tax=Nitrospirillum viridazoti TaxID=3144925 RepID=UPI00110FAA1B|nr:DUF2971 domain-containing protein [Nitrospirillum amazonense]
MGWQKAGAENESSQETWSLLPMSAHGQLYKVMILYKYMSLATAQTILATNRIGFSRASFLNDPFDTPVAAPIPTSDPIEGLFASISAQGKSMVWEQNTAFLSLTRTITNSLMWSHYADSHRGVALAINTATAGFLNLETNLIPAHFGSVIYSRHRPSGPYYSSFTTPIPVGGLHRFALDHYEKWQRMFLTKPIEWAYEEEVRVAKCVRGLKLGNGKNDSGSCTVIDLGSGRLLHCFDVPATSISGIYFGARVTDIQIAETIKGHPGLQAARARLDQNRFAIDLIPFN